MTKIRFLTGLIVMATFVSACAPSQPAIEASSSLVPATTVALTASPLPVATSRGPNLEATDPTTVSVASGGLQLVEFFRFTWATCRSMAPMVHGLEAKYFGRIQFSYLDADDPQTADFQRSLGFYYQPELYLLDGEGKVLEKWVGYTTQEELETAFTEQLK